MVERRDPRRLGESDANYAQREKAFWGAVERNEAKLQAARNWVERRLER